MGDVRTWLGPDIEVVGTRDPDVVDKELPDCDGILDAHMAVHFDERRLQRASGLKAFAAATTGSDHVAATYLEERGIPLLTLRGQAEVLAGLTAAAEHSWLLLLACARRLPAARAHVLDGGWDRTLFPGAMLRGKSLGIVGCGRIGRWMARYAAAFGMHPMGFDPEVADWPPGIERHDTLRALLERSEFLTIHVPLTDSTKGLIGPEELRALPAGAVVVNTSRGEVIHQEALLEALRSGHVSAAGVDVLAGEPATADNPLVEYARENDDLIITPHIGGFSPDAVRAVVEFSCARLLPYLASDV